MRRLFSTFAHGAPGAGLLVLRAAAAAALLAPGVHLLTGAPAELGVIGSVLCAVDGLLVGLGLWTPLAAGFGTVLALARASGLPAHAAGGLMLAAVTAALALLGPGAWSVDARLFGWKRIEIAPRKSHEPGAD
jgi:hypothetical protein